MFSRVNDFFHRLFPNDTKGEIIITLSGTPKNPEIFLGTSADNLKEKLQGNLQKSLSKHNLNKTHETTHDIDVFSLKIEDIKKICAYLHTDFNALLFLEELKSRDRVGEKTYRVDLAAPRVPAISLAEFKEEYKDQLMQERFSWIKRNVASKTAKGLSQMFDASSRNPQFQTMQDVYDTIRNNPNEKCRAAQVLAALREKKAREMLHKVAPQTQVTRNEM